MTETMHFVRQLRVRLREINAEGKRLRKLIKSLKVVKSQEFVATLADAEMLRVILPSAHSMPRAICPHCQRNRALRRGRQVFYRHDPCGIVRTKDGKRYQCEQGRGVIAPEAISEEMWQ